MGRAVGYDRVKNGIKLSGSHFGACDTFISSRTGATYHGLVDTTGQGLRSRRISYARPNNQEGRLLSNTYKKTVKIEGLQTPGQ